ncbi:autotransporter outer membrane beta-barrel domain-containing protein, partial [Legionella sp. CNM-4043-24]|uniref:autotransporter outer membrane beta-barrel domain-containing protein n=1 Tax=Legionella sp. CNM-4043-24 TaxID=3421646 RepID=UPI00403AA50E
SGQGWMIGPYLSARIAPDLYLHTRAAWGQSDNQMTIMNIYQNHFNTGRSLYNAELTGDWQYRNWRLSPTTGFTYYQENQYRFTNSANVSIPGQRISLGQFNFGPEISYFYLSETLRRTTTSLSFEGIYNFDPGGRQNLVFQNFFDGFSGRVKLGLDIVFPSGLSIGPSLQYDGIGRNAFSAIQGQIQFSIPLDNIPSLASRKSRVK